MNANDKNLRFLFSAMAAEDARSAPGFTRLARPRGTRERPSLWPFWAIASATAAAVALFAIPSRMALTEDPTNVWAEQTEWATASDALLTASALPFETTSATDAWMEGDDSAQANTL